MRDAVDVCFRGLAVGLEPGSWDCMVEVASISCSLAARG